MHIGLLKIHNTDKDLIFQQNKYPNPDRRAKQLLQQNHLASYVTTAKSYRRPSQNKIKVKTVYHNLARRSCSPKMAGAATLTLQRRKEQNCMKHMNILEQIGMNSQIIDKL